MAQNGKGIYFGWYIVLTCFLLMALAYAPSTTLVGQFLVPMATDFDITVTVSSTIVTIGMLAAMIASPIAGKLLTKYGTRKLVVAMLLVSAVSNAGMCFAPNFVLINVFAAFRGVALAFVGMVPISMMVMTWFGKSAQGRAMAFATIGSGIGAMAVSPLLAVIIEDISWRYGYLLFTGLSLLCVPLVLITFAPSPAAKGLTRLGDDPGAKASGAPLTGMTGGEAMKSGMFWMVLLGFIFVSGVCQTWVNNAPGFYSGKLGLSAIMVGTLIAVTALTLTLGKIGLGIFCDKFGVKLGFLVSVACLTATYVLGIVGEAGVIVSMGIVCAVVMGLGQSSLNITMPLVVNQICGNKDYGVCMGYVQAGTAIGAGFLPLGTTIFLDQTGNYATTFVIAGALAVAAIGLIFGAYAVQGKKVTI
jgi:MFS family permease